MLSVEKQPSWMPSRIGGAAFATQELALNAPKEAPPEKDFSLFGEDGFNFADLIDVVNPLQHIPLISTFYREATGDQIAPGPRVLGSTLFFGPIGFASAMANVMVEESTGKDIGEHMASWITPEPPVVQTAENPGNNLAIQAAADPANPPAASDEAGDPVIAWARNEIAWARQNAQEFKPAPKPAGSTAIKSAPADTVIDPSIPDATPLLHGPEPAQPVRPAVPGPVDLAQRVVLSSDLRSATWAYEAAANLRS